MAFTESLLLQKGHFLFSKRVFFQQILFSLLKKVRGAHAPIASPVPQPLVLMNKAII
jgi:hypothetical protein